MYLLGVPDGVCMGHGVQMADNLWEAIASVYYVSPGVELTPSGMVASLFTQWAVLLASNDYFKTLKESLFSENRK